MWGGGGGGGGGGHGWGFHGHGGLDDEELGQIYNHDVVKRLYPFFRDRLRLFMLAMVMMLVYTVTLVATPWLIGFTVDNYIITGDRAGLNQAGLIFLGLVAANYAGNYAYMRLLGKISQHILYQLRTAMFDHLQVLSVPFFDRNEVGRI
ncbi:MAG: ABC transporter transmembrane domain-containing protein, partial [Chloroflexi bacterium]|nr:ABC transporter transmembrane domain-containing protein [Chloroflexota bacterium]